jgi:hypothetical protein
MLPPNSRRIGLILAPLLAFGGAAIAATSEPVPSAAVVPSTGAPLVTTGSVSQLGATSAQLTGRINPTGQDTTYFFNYGLTTAYGSTTPAGTLPAGSVPVSVRAKIDALATGALYHYQLVATSPAGTTLGADQTFTPIAGLSKPTVTTGPPLTVAGTSATVSGLVNPNGQPANYRFNYGTTSAYGQTTANQPIAAGAADVTATATLNGLTVGETYHYRLVASGIAGTTLGQDQVFVAGQAPPAAVVPVPPTVATGAPSGVTVNGAVLSGTLNPSGLETSYSFEWGTTTAYGGATPPITVAAGAAEQAVGGLLVGLTPATTYHVRLIATNAAGTVQGADQTFTTLPEPVVQPPATTPTTPVPPVRPTGPTTPPGGGPGSTGLPAGPDAVPQPPDAGAIAGIADDPQPVVSDLRVRPARVVATKPPRRTPTSTRVTFWLSVPAAVTVTLSAPRSQPASCSPRAGTRCVQRPVAGLRVVQRIVMTGYAGPNAALLRLRRNGRALPPGRYTVTAQALAGGFRSAAARAALRLVAR